ncbi:MAG TPA: universal stress protein [Pseudomonas sp.]|uniref:universal stress protein n=1 Tax=Pseudomonas sp. TaxID=306 RepID=UPI002ED9C2F1
MPQINRILVATDLSVPARHAAERAAMLSKELQASLDLLYVANLAPLERLGQMMAPQDDLLQRVLDAAREKLEQLGATLLQRYDVAGGVRVLPGSVLTELTRQVDEMAINLLVCGARGESAVRHLLLGSTAQRLLSHMICPVLVVKQTPRREYRTLLVPVDFSPSSLRAIRDARAIAPHAEITLLHVFDAPFEGGLRFANVDADTLDHYRIIARKEATEKLYALREEAGLPPYATRLVTVHGDASWRIVEQEQELDCDLIVMGKHGQSALQELLVGSVTKHVLAESQSDVLVSV